HPTTQSTKVTMMFAHSSQLIDSAVRHQAEVSRIERQGNIGEPCDYSVEGEITETQNPRFVATDALRVDNVVTLIVQLYKLRNDLRRVLQVAIHHHRSITVDVVESCRQGSLVPKITRKRDDSDTRVVLRGLLEQFESVIGTAIVHKHYFVRASRELVENPAHSAQYFRQDGLFIEDCNRD